MMAMTRTAAFRAALPVGALATSSDRIDVCGWPRQDYRDSSSAELINVRFKSSFTAGSLLVGFFFFSRCFIEGGAIILKCFIKCWQSESSRQLKSLT